MTVDFSMATLEIAHLGNPSSHYGKVTSFACGVDDIVEGRIHYTGCKL